jgi:hypothetical protein
MTEIAEVEVVADCGEVEVYPIEEGTGLSVRIYGDTIWLTQKQMAMLFGCSVMNVSQHLKNIFFDGELVEKVVIKEFFNTTQHGAMGGKTQTRSVTHYNLDAVISVGFRVATKRGIAFRQWANKVLRDRMMAKFAPPPLEVRERKPRAKRIAPALPEPRRKAKSAATCMKCLFGRLVESEKKGIFCECHVARPTQSGFPMVRPDDFCPLHVMVRSKKRTFAGLVPEIPQIVPPAVTDSQM